MKKAKLFLALLLLLIPLGKTIAYDFCVDGVYYNITSSDLNYVSVTYGEYSSGTYSGELVIPSSVAYNGTTYKVNGITASACYYCTELTSVHIPATVTSVGASAFYYCNKLQDVYISDLTAWCKISWGDTYSSRPFSYAKNLYLNNELVTKLELTASNLSTFKECFKGCNSLTEVVVKSGVYQLTGTFQNCYNLCKVTIPASVTSIDGTCFYGCSKLTEVIFEDGTSTLRLGDYEYWGGRYNDNHHHLGAFASCPLTKLYIGRNLSFSFNPFYHYDDEDDDYYSNENIQRIEIGPKVTSIPINFGSCDKLNSIVLNSLTPPTKETISATAYENCKLIIPWEADKEYRAAEPWKNFKTIRYHKTDNELAMSDAKIFAGQTLNIPVMLNNTATINSIGGVITLPEGMTIEKNAKGKFNIKLNENRASVDDAFSISTSQQADGSVKFLIVSTDGTDIYGNDGAVMYIPVVIGNELGGEYEIKLSSVQMSDAKGGLINSPNAYSVVTVEQYMLGDVNRDWQIAPNDITMAIKSYIGETPADFCFLAADINANSEIDPADITSIIKLYLGENSAATRKAMPTMAKTAETTQPEDRVILSNTMVENNGECVIDISMDLKRDDYTSLGGIITIPEGFSFVKNAKNKPIVTKNNDVLEYHSVSSNLLNDHQLKFLISSMDLDLIPAGESLLISIKVKADENIATGNHSYTLTAMQLSDYDANLYNANDTEGCLRVLGTEEIALTIPETGWATLCLPFDAELPNGLKAYKATGIEGEYVTLEKQSSIEATIPLLISGPAGTYTFSGDNSGATEFVYNCGLLTGVLAPTVFSEGYVLQQHDGEFGFYRLTKERTLPAYKCLLNKANAAAPTFLWFAESETTGISSMKEIDSNDTIYTLSGQKVKEISVSGVYIVNGKKVLIK